MVEHQILLMKLGAYGVANTPLSWFQSDLMNRQQVVSIDGSDSESVVMKHGVPQGSILGQLLFILFINDLLLRFIFSNRSIPDDTNLKSFANFKDTAKFHNLLNTSVSGVTKWANNQQATS